MSRETDARITGPQNLVTEQGHMHKSGISPIIVLAMAWLSEYKVAIDVQDPGSLLRFTSRCIAVKLSDDANRHISVPSPFDQYHGVRAAASSLTWSADHQYHGKRSAFQGNKSRAQDLGRADDLHGKRTASRGLDALTEDGPDATGPDFVNP